jgi:hypothetical protein
VTWDTTTVTIVSAHRKTVSNDQAITAVVTLLILSLASTFAGENELCVVAHPV